MNEPKFRAWDKENDVMRYGVCVSWNAYNSGNLIISVDDEYGDWKEIDSKFLMQYTGLKDKNGVEIFEGDVVTGENFLFPFPDNRPLPIYWDEETGGFQLNAFNKKTIEILGNIYEDGDWIGIVEDIEEYLSEELQEVKDDSI
ncbi:YopX family protein [Enterococcus sp. AZ126]|uniref:YopX family protein n=1 Tax=Enterococcus sp. AZ126 TaxID=2774635 RepID=UPI003F2945B4